MAFKQIFLEHSRSFQSINSYHLFSKLCGFTSLTTSLCFIFSVLFSDILLVICGVFFVSQIYCFISTPFKLLVPFYFICFENPALKCSFSVFSSVYFPRCCFKITFISVLIFLLHLFSQLHQVFLFYPHFTTLVTHDLSISFELICDFFNLHSWSNITFLESLVISVLLLPFVFPVLFLPFYCNSFVVANSML